MDLLQITIKLAIGFIMLFIFVRLIGGKLIDQITPFHFISAIVLSELLGNAVYHKDTPSIFIVYTILIWGILLFIIEYISIKSLILRNWLEGKPLMVIRNGEIDYEILKKARINLNQLQSLLRQSETFSMREVAFAFIEPNGSLSVLKKSPYQKPKTQDFSMPIHSVYLPITLIRDGQLIEENLWEIAKDQQWLKSYLLTKGIENISDVLFAEWLEKDGLFVISKI